MIRTWSYLLREAIANIRLNRTTSVVAIVTTGFTLACLGVFLLVYLNLRGMTTSLAKEIKVIVYLEDNLTHTQVEDLQRELERQQAVAGLSYVSKDQALEEFQTQFPNESQLLEGLGENPLPASFLVTLAARFRAPDFVHRWAEQFKSFPGVAEVEYSQDWVENLTALLRNLEGAALSVGLILSLASVTIIANTIRLTVNSRRHELHILQLVGATGLFIKLPYLVEGAILGGVGGVMSLAILKGGFEVFRLQMESTTKLLGTQAWLSYFPGHLMGILVLIGLVLGVLGSFISVVRLQEASGT
ncbi:cell division protein FtsX [Nitrospira sp.]|nr:cell division protein FtsX [Nitrospira sp.]